MKTILVDAINALIIKETGIFKEMLDLLEQYPNKKIILSGANEEEKEKFGLNNLPYSLFTLMHNPDKQDPEYYKTLLKKYSLKAENTIYFEHNEEAVKSAESIGIKTYHYDKDKKDLDSLKVFLDENII